jgi:hypothetical protein
MRHVEEKWLQGERNADAYRQGMRDAAAVTNFGRPSRCYPTAEEQASYEMGFYEELEAMEEEFLDGAPEEGQNSRER